VINFDTFPWAFVNVIVVSSMANWVDIMFPIWDTTSWLVYLFMLAIILMVAFFAVNVFLVSCVCVTSVFLARCW
jgi:hypothetical protein